MVLLHPGALTLSKSIYGIFINYSKVHMKVKLRKNLSEFLRVKFNEAKNCL